MGETYGNLPWADEETFRELLARTWLWGEDADWDSFPESSAWRDLLPLLGPVAALQTYGTAQGAQARERAILEALAWAPLPPRDTAGARERQRKVGEFSLLVRQVAGKLQEAEEVLDREGWRFDPGERKVVRARVDSRPSALRRKLAVLLVKALRDGRVENDQSLRVEVCRVLAWWLPGEDCDPSKGGPIDQDLKNELRKRRG
jgi:hypothetical protein